MRQCFHERREAATETIEHGEIDSRRLLTGGLFDSIENVAPALKRLPAREVFIQHGAGAGAHGGERVADR